MLFCKALGVQRRSACTRTRTEPDLKAELGQDELLSHRYKVPVPGRSIVQVQSIVLVLVLLGSLVSVEGTLNEDQEELLVELHNRYRGVVQPSASAMLPLRWDGNLKLLAEGYAAKCEWNHNPDLEDTGENLFAGTGKLDLERALEKWFLERVDYNYYNNSCEEDKMCGHYTQMVWADTHRVGCAVHLCAQMEGLDWTDPTQFLVCNYFPAGNYDDERPYVEGDWCSQCPANLQTCENNLCAPDEDEEPSDSDLIEDSDSTIFPDPEPVLKLGHGPDQDPDENTDQHPDQDTDQHPDQDTDHPEETTNQEAVVPPPATEFIAPEPLGTVAPEKTEIALKTGPENAPETGPEAGPEPEPKTPKEDPAEDPAGGAVVHTDKEHKSNGRTPPTQPPPPGPKTPSPENRGQKQKGSMEKRSRETLATSHSVILSGSWSLVFLWMCL
ncbi:uncharacterized protein [Eucyclogobius newberryi]|uniref:uncharacterized protein n=1 Tax=Eucyclogobius newberryi TaxID=166745 RepID=UPI003B590BB8